MTDILENKEMTEINEGEMNFEEMLEESLKSFTTDEKSSRCSRWYRSE